MGENSRPEVLTADLDGQVVRRATIHRPAAELYAIVANPELHSAVDGSGTVGTVIRADEGEVRAGASFTITMKRNAVRYKVTSQVTKAIPGRVLEWRHPQGHHWRWEFKPTDAMTTEVTHTFDYRGNAMKALLRLMGVMKSNGRGMERSLVNLASVPAPRTRT